MINLYMLRKKITNKIKATLKYLIDTYFGRYILGAILCIIGGVFSPYGTIEFLSTDYELFTYITVLGEALIVAQTIWLIGAAIYFSLYKED